MFSCQHPWQLKAPTCQPSSQGDPTAASKLSDRVEWSPVGKHIMKLKSTEIIFTFLLSFFHLLINALEHNWILNYPIDIRVLGNLYGCLYTKCVCIERRRTEKGFPIYHCTDTPLTGSTGQESTLGWLGQPVPNSWEAAYPHRTERCKASGSVQTNSTD